MFRVSLCSLPSSWPPAEGRGPSRSSPTPLPALVALCRRPKWLPKSSYVVPGIYCYDHTVVSKAKTLNFSDRGELEITDINKAFLNESSLEVKVLNEDTVWLDTGTVDSLMNANQFVETLQQRKGILVGSPELSAFQNNLITKETLSLLVESMTESKYGEFLKLNS